MGVVLGADKLKPISWRVWAGRIEKEERENGGEGNLGKGKGAVGGNPFAELEVRSGFMDIRVCVFQKVALWQLLVMCMLDCPRSVDLSANTGC